MPVAMRSVGHVFERRRERHQQQGSLRLTRPAEMPSNQRARAMIRRLICRFIGCFQCRTYETPEGIGGKCISCGRIHGWMSRDDLAKIIERGEHLQR